MIEIFLPLISATLWASSSFVINHGLKRAQIRSALEVLWPLYYCTISGTIFSLMVHIEKVNLAASSDLHWVLISGLFTYVLATASYYVTASLFKERAEFAAQFTKIKPLMTLLIGSLLLPTAALGSVSVASIVFIMLGIGIYINSARKGQIRLVAVLAGLCTAMFWAIGEVTLKLGLNGIDGYTANTLALIAALIALTVIVIPLTISKKIRMISPITAWPFMLHGVLSFFLAYGFFFESINKLGLGPTILITAFWPFLSLLFSAVYDIFSKRKSVIPAAIWLGSLFLLTGSIIQIFTITR